MSLVVIENLDNLRCPTCSERLLAQAGEHKVVGRRDPIYVQDGGSLWCRHGHELPSDRNTLYQWRDENGFAAPDENEAVRRIS